MDFRSYDPAIGRFNGIDPVTHFSHGTSVAFDNNPIYWADPSGADAYSVTNSAGTDWSGMDLGSRNSNNENNDEDCPECDNKNILIDFVNSAGYKQGYDEETKKLNKRKAKKTTESFPANEEDDKNAFIILRGSMVMIKGPKFKDGNWSEGGKRKYEFNQEIILEDSRGSQKIVARGLMLISENVEENNIAYIKAPAKSIGYTGEGEIYEITFLNSKQKKVASLRFKTENHMDAFMSYHFDVHQRYGLNQARREYNGDDSIKIKH